MTFTQKNEDAILDIIDVTPKNINKRNMKIKFSDGEFVLYGPWEMEIKQGYKVIYIIVKYCYN